jgi:alkylation response protein AidB-like acyl-CoA dehydrogenase
MAVTLDRERVRARAFWPATGPAVVRDGPESSGRTDWLDVARGLAGEFRQTVVQRERNAIRPLAEIQRFRDTGLVNLLIAKHLGGKGATVGDAARVVREISKADGSLGFLLAFHYSHATMSRAIDPVAANVIERRSAENNWFWGNVIGPFHLSGEATPDGGLIVFGTKHMATGASLGDAIQIMGKWTDRDEMFFAAIPTDRPGIVIKHDWDALGLRASETHTVTLDRVVVYPEEVVRPAGPLNGFAAFANIAIFSAAFHLGSLLGALEETKAYLATTPANPRPFGAPGALPNEDPFIQLEYGKIWIRLQAIEALFEQQIREIELAQLAGPPADPKVAGERARRTTALQVEAGNIALEFTGKLFELTGGRSTARNLGLDRFWRDVRTYTVHHPESYVIKSLGEAALGLQPRKFSFLEVRKQYEEQKAARASADPS